LHGASPFKVLHGTLTIIAPFKATRNHFKINNFLFLLIYFYLGLYRVIILEQTVFIGWGHSH